MIPAEAVEAAAEFLPIEYSQQPYERARLIAALEAAAPHMRVSSKTEVTWDHVNAQLNSLLRAPVNPDEPTEDMGQ